MKILLIGERGQLARELIRSLITLGELSIFDFPEIDLSKPGKLPEIIRSISPQIIINAAAFTDVDKAEKDPTYARQVNAIAPSIMADEAKKINAGFFHFSTDYVFDGTKGSSYNELDIPNPINEYGNSKLEGERLIQSVGAKSIIIRTSWLYSKKNGGFLSKVILWAREKEVLQIVDDQFGSPTWTRMLANVTAQIIAQGRDDPIEYMHEKTGLYHCGGLGCCSRYEWVKAILEFDQNSAEHKFKEFLSCSMDDLPTIAKRPHNTSLNCDLICNVFHFHLSPWKSTLKLSMSE